MNPSNSHSSETHPGTPVAVPAPMAAGMSGNKREGASRNPAIDFTKGALVVLMVVYHWFNYFVSTTGEFYRYINFITPSFIFVSGFLISNVLIKKYGATDSTLQRRLLYRGLRLLLLFIIINLLAAAVVRRNYNGMDLGALPLIHEPYRIFISGAGKGAIFDILVPISYVLILSPLLIKAALAARIPLAVAAFVVFSMVSLACVLWQPGGILELMGAGLLGLTLGALPAERFESVLRQPVLLGSVYLIYLTSVTLWNIVYPVKILAVCANLWLLYWLGVFLSSQGFRFSRITKLGQYTLFAYISQIAILQLLRATRIAEGNTTTIGLLLLLAVLLTWTGVAVVDRVRGQFRPVDRLYRVIFG